MRLALMAALLLSCGCGGDDDEGRDAGLPDTGVPENDAGEDGGVDEDLAQYANVVCHRLNQCAPTDMQMLTGGDVDACIAREVETLAPAFALPGVNVDLRACAAMLGGLGCGQILRIARLQTVPPSGCFLPGSLTDGAACLYPPQCESFVCQRPSGTSCGQCAAALDVGDDCSDRTDLLGSPCGPGRTCAEGVCVALGELGQACELPGAPCFADLGCVGGVCGPPAHEGDACTSVLGECDLDAEALVCNPFTSTCIAGTFVGVGETCGIQGDVPAACADSDCLPDALDGTCVARAADDEPCDSLNGPRCMPHAQCVGGACEPYFTPLCE